jgi:hypothetical protein
MGGPPLDIERRTTPVDEPTIQADPLSSAEVDEAITEAIQAGSLNELIGALLADSNRLSPPARLRVMAADEAVEAIEMDVDDECRRLTALLDARGIRATSADHRSGRPLHLVALQVERDDVSEAARLIVSAGYRRLGARGDAAWRSMRATRSGCSFVPIDDAPFQVELGWPGGVPPGFVSRLLAPHDTDFDAVTLPVRLWPVYSLVHLVRLPIRRWRRAPDLGPFLTTPTSLIEPLLRFGGLGPDDLLVDLGCGDGRILVRAVEVFGCRARGIEADPELVTRARALVSEANGEDRIEIVEGDIFDAPLDDAQVIVAFLPVGLLRRVLPSVLGRLAPGARLVVHEQELLLATPPAPLRTPLLTTGGISVAHRWDGGPSSTS